MFLSRKFAFLAMASAILGATSGTVALARSLSDAKPQEGVAAAHDMPVQGIDVSYWQGDIDWAKVRDADVRFTFIKATEGADHVDPKFIENWEGAKRAGVSRGAYHFLYWCSPADEQALWFMLNVPPDPDALPPVLDAEWNSHSKTCPHHVARDVALKKIKIMLDAMEAHTGKRPIIYTDPVFYRDVLDGAFTNYHFWLRSVAAEPGEVYPQRSWAFWQFTTTGTVPGVNGKVDRNSYNGTQGDWDRVLKWLQAGH